MTLNVAIVTVSKIQHKKKSKQTIVHQVDTVYSLKSQWETANTTLQLPSKIYNTTNNKIKKRILSLFVEYLTNVLLLFVSVIYCFFFACSLSSCQWVILCVIVTLFELPRKQMFYVIGWLWFRFLWCSVINTLINAYCRLSIV